MITGNIAVFEGRIVSVPLTVLSIVTELEDSQEMSVFRQALTPGFSYLYIMTLLLCCLF